MASASSSKCSWGSSAWGMHHSSVPAAFMMCSLACCRYRIINQLVDFRYEPARVAEVKRRFLRLDQCIPLDGFLTGWFLGAPVESIRRGNVEDFVAYGFYSRYMHQLPPHVSTPHTLAHASVSCRRRAQSGRTGRSAAAKLTRGQGFTGGAYSPWLCMTQPGAIRALVRNSAEILPTLQPVYGRQAIGALASWIARAVVGSMMSVC